MDIILLLLKSYFIVGLTVAIPYLIGFWSAGPSIEGSLPMRVFKMVTASVMIFLLVLAGYWMILLAKIYNHGRDMGGGINVDFKVRKPEYEYTYAYTLDGVRAHEDAGWEHIPSNRADFVRDQRFHLRRKI